MAMFYSENAFNINDLDLNLIYRQSHSTAAGPGGSTPFVPPLLTFAGVDYTVPSVTISYGGSLQLTSGATSVLFGGDGLTYSGSGALTGGTLRLFGQSTSGLLDYFVLGVSIPGTDYNAAAQTAATADDIALFKSVFSGNDLVTLSAHNDVFDAGLGKDLVIDGGGADRVTAGGGDDMVMPGKGNDWVDGGAGNDLVVGATGDDKLRGGTGQDVLWAGVGSDTVTGGLGRDAFVFKAGDGTATIVDFNAADDQIVFVGPTADLANLRMRQIGADLKVTFADVSVLLLNTLRADVSAGDVVAGGNALLATTADAFFAGWDYVA